MKSPIRITTRHVATHPVARAVAQANLLSAVRTFQIRLHLLTQGENVFPDMLICDQLFTIVLNAGATDPVLRGAHSAIKQCLDRKGAWRLADLTAIDQGLLRLVETYPTLNPRAIAAAWQGLK